MIFKDYTCRICGEDVSLRGAGKHFLKKHLDWWKTVFKKKRKGGKR